MEAATLAPEGVPPFADLFAAFGFTPEIRFNPRLSHSWRVHWERPPARRSFLSAFRPAEKKPPRITLVLPGLLEHAPFSVKAAVLEWALLVIAPPQKRRQGRPRRRELENLIRAFLFEGAEGLSGGRPEVEALLRRVRRKNDRRLAALNPQGRFFDLQPVFEAVNREYFAGNLVARITWSNRLGGLSTHSERQGPDGGTYHLLSISRGYDAPEVTPEILGGIVYHECLHIAVPPVERNGRRQVHGPEFRRRERLYRHYAEWMAWHRQGLLASLRRQRREAASKR